MCSCTELSNMAEDVHVHVCMHDHVHVHMCMHVHVHVCMCTCAHVLMYCCNCVCVHVCMCTCANVFLQWCQWCLCAWACASVYPSHLLHLHTCVITHMKRAYLSKSHAMQHPVPCITRALAIDLTLLPFHLKLALCLLVSNPCVS